jgi:MscS family membrane protein
MDKNFLGIFWGSVTTMKIGSIELWRLGSFFIVILLSLVVGRVVKFCIERFAKRFSDKHREGLAVFLKSIASSLMLMSFALGFWLGAGMFTVGARIESILDTVVRMLAAASIGYAVYCLVDVIDHYLSRLADRTASKVDDMLVPMVGKSIRITVALVVLLQVVQSLSDKPITSIVAGLGVGGLAVALAGQDTIKNFFGSLVIVGDKPFEIGDRIVVDGHDGPVESVGFRSTKIRTLSGHLVTVPNGELANKTILNIGKRPYIRRLSNITVTYDTPPDKILKAIEIVKDILADHEGMSPEFPPKVYFSDFNDCSLNIMMIYWYHPPDYWKYMEFTQRVNMEILERFNAEGIDFAFPSETVYLANDDKRQLAVRMLKDGV